MIKNEPLWTRATITALVAAVIGVAVSFGLPVTDEQQAQIMALVAVAAPLLVAAITRHKVTPTDKSGS